MFVEIFIFIQLLVLDIGEVVQGSFSERLEVRFGFCQGVEVLIVEGNWLSERVCVCLRVCVFVCACTFVKGQYRRTQRIIVSWVRFFCGGSVVVQLFDFGLVRRQIWIRWWFYRFVRVRVLFSVQGYFWLLEGQKGLAYNCYLEIGGWMLLLLVLL